MRSKLEKKIKNSRLTRVETKIAEYILANINSACFMTSTDLAAAVGVSDASVIRLSRALGYKGYQDMQRDLQAAMRKQVESGSEFEALLPLEKLSRIAPDITLPEMVRESLNLNIAALKSLLSARNLAAMENIIQLLMQAEGKFIFGFRGNKTIADRMGQILAHILPNVRRCVHADSEAVELMLDIKPGDCVVLFSYWRDSAMSFEVAERARECGASLVVFSERFTCPVAENADALLISDVRSMSFFNSLASPLFAIELIASSIGKKMGGDHEKRLLVVEERLKSTGLY